MLLRCTACIDAAFAYAVLATCSTAERVPADASLSATEAVQIRRAITLAASSTKKDSGWR